MKDVNHHLKYTQKKVIQSARKEQLQELVAASASNNGNSGNSSKKTRKPSFWTS